ncbi:MAG: hypothetical protein K0R68_582 [Mycobacterium sp.]|nr:hypothetical protein [Mycobacterium sp.]
MGNTHTTRVDVGALETVADRFDEAAGLIGQAAARRMTFDGADAGRAHAVWGDQLRLALDSVYADLTGWARASAEIAAALRVGARRYRDADQSAARGIG